MKTLHRKILVLIIVITSILPCFAQIRCNQGDQNKPLSFDGVTVTEKNHCASDSTQCVRPVDPNEIIGLNGYDIPNSSDTMRWVSSTKYLMYTIYFENDPNLATAAAQRVEVRHKLHTKADMSTFGVGSYGIGQNMFVVDGYLSSYQTRLDLTTDTSGYYVDVIAGLDIVTNEAFWIFQTIDPQTGLPPIGINDGFLPVNDSLHSGEGQVTFRIKPKEFQCVTGDTVTAKASIVFDVNEAIPTNKWINTIDAVAPTTSVVGSLNASQDSLVLQFNGNDDYGGSGLKQFKLFVSENEGQYIEIGEYLAGQTALYPVEEGRYYRFISLGEDNVGNIEPTKTAPDFEYGIMMCNVTVVALPGEYGTVAGSGLFARGTSVTVTSEAIPNYHLVRWASEGITQSYDDTYTFTVESDIELTALFEEDTFPYMTQLRSLVSGWNWYSTYIEQNNINGLEMLENSLGFNGLLITSQSVAVQNYYQSLGYNYWFGPLDAINNEESYMINVDSDRIVDLTGRYANPTNHPITISPDWNWIGYPVRIEQNVGTALNNFIAEPNDVVKNHAESSIYYENYGWFPLINMVPGEGYQYKSNATTNKTLIYNVNRNDILAMSDDRHLWTNNYHLFANNLTVVAAVYVNNERIAEDNIELGAFVNNECRGSALLNYFEPLECYYAILTVAGEDGENIDFGIIDKKSLQSNFDSNDHIVFKTNAVFGNIDNPYQVHFKSPVDGLLDFSLYPNPVNKFEKFTIGIPYDKTINEIVIRDILGNVVYRVYGDERSITGLAASGVYNVQVIMDSGIVYHSRLIVK